MIPLFTVIISVFISLFGESSSGVRRRKLVGLSRTPTCVRRIVNIRLPPMRLSGSSVNCNSRFASRACGLAFDRPLSRSCMTRLRERYIRGDRR